MKRALLVAILLAGCSSGPAAEVLVLIDAQPRLLAEARSMRIRVWNQDDMMVYDEELSIGAGEDEFDFPARVPVIPADGDATRTFLLEATLESADGAAIALSRVEGRFVPGEVREIAVCMVDYCLRETCGLTEDCLDGECATCEGERACVPAARESVGLGMATVNCPPPDCTPSSAMELSCTDGMDEDCDAATDCEDDACDGQSCGPMGQMCVSGVCVCPTTEVCDDAVSNDCDGLNNCADPECNGQPCGGGFSCNSSGACEVCVGGTPEDCDNGDDDDCDGWADCQDPDCCTFGNCPGRQCMGMDNRRCCGNECVRIDLPDNCGGCNGRCAIDPVTSAPRRCRLIESVPAADGAGGHAGAQATGVTTPASTAATAARSSTRRCVSAWSRPTAAMEWTARSPASSSTTTASPERRARSIRAHAVRSRSRRAS